MRARVVFLGFFLVLCIGALAAGVYFMPVSVGCKVLKDRMYADTVLEKDDVSVTYKTLLGRRYAAPAYLMRMRKGGASVDVLSAGCVTNVATNRIDIADRSISYDGTVYVGQTIDPENISVSALYADKTERPVPVFGVDRTDVPMAEEYTVCVDTGLGDMNLVLEPVVPDRIEASYDGLTRVGDPYDPDRLKVTIFYPDGTSFDISDYEVTSAPKYFSGKQKIVVDSQYGTVSFTVDPVDVDSVSVVYTGTVYEGDSIDRNAIVFTAKMKNGKELSVDDFTYADPSPVKVKTTFDVKSRFGEGTIVVEPVKFTSLSVDLPQDLTEGDKADVGTIHMTYEDGAVRDVGAGDVFFMNLPETWSGGDSEIFFEYHGIVYSFHVTAMPSAIADLRVDDPNVPSDAIKYPLSVEQMREIAIICQKAAGTSGAVGAAEASLMANRYELYGNGEEGNAEAFLSYVKSDGYWGSDLDTYISEHTADAMLLYVMTDVLVNGHRTLPSYVDDRAVTQDISEMTTYDYESDQTIITKVGEGGSFRFYKFPSDDHSEPAYGYSDDAYMRVNLEMPPIPTPATPVTEAPAFDDAIVIGDAPADTTLPDAVVVPPEETVVSDFDNMSPMAQDTVDDGISFG